MIGCRCGGTYRNVKTGVALLTHASFGPYQLWSSDRLECDECGHEVYRTAAQPMDEHFRDGFAEHVDGNRHRGNLHELLPR